jgi:hypothetical protein
LRSTCKKLNLMTPDKGKPTIVVNLATLLSTERILASNSLGENGDPHLIRPVG